MSHYNYFMNTRQKKTEGNNSLLSVQIMPDTLHALAIRLKDKHHVSHFKRKKLKATPEVKGLTPGRVRRKMR